MGKMIELTASDGHKLAAYRAEPAGKPRGGIVVIQEIFGVNSHIRSVADGYAADGYLAIAPAMFDRVQKNFEVGYTPDDMTKGRETRAKVTDDMALKDAEARRDQGIEPQAGDRQGTSAGGTRPSEQYVGRQQLLEHELEMARRRYDAALRRWNDLK